MKLDKKTHLVDVARMPAGDLTNGGKLMAIRRCLVIHYTEGGAAKTSVGWWNQPQNRSIDLGAHFIIERSGLIYQCRATNRTISHAGKSKWTDPNTGISYSNLNSCSIGIELANTGDECDRIKGEEQLVGYAGTMMAKHMNDKPADKARKWEAYSEAQINACIELSKILVEGYNLDDVTGHDYIAGNRKTDPGPAFPMQRVREACGFKGLPDRHFV